MKRLCIAVVGVLLLFCSGSGMAATVKSEVVATVTVTNVSGTTNGQTISYSTDTRTHTNNPTSNPQKFIQTTNSIGAVTTNLALHFVRAKFPDGVTLSGTGTNSITFLSQVNSNLTISVSPGWATVSYTTNLYTNMVPVRSPIKNEPSSTTASNVIDGIVDALPWSTISVPEFIAAFSNYISLSATQTFGNKTLTNTAHKGGSMTNAEVRGILIIYHAGETNGSGINFGQHRLISGASGNAQLIQASDGNAAEPNDPADIITYYWGNLIYPSLGGTNVWQGPNTWFGSNWFRGGLRGTNADFVNGTLTNLAGAFSGLTATNLTGLGGYLSNLFGNSITLSNAPVIHVLNLQGFGGYLSNIFLQSITISNAASINGIIGLLTGGSWSNATINGLSASNSVWSGTNVVTGDISYPWFDLTSIGAGNNIAVPLGTNTFVALSGNGGAAALCGFAGLRNGKPVKLLNRSGFAMSLVQTTIDPVPANRIVGNIAGDLAFNPGEWVDIVWDNAAARWRFVVPLAAGTNFVTSGRNDTNLSVFPSSSNNVPLRVFAAVNQNTNIQQWLDGSSNVVASIGANGGLNIGGTNDPGKSNIIAGAATLNSGFTNNGFTSLGGSMSVLGLSTNTGQQSQWIATSNITATASNTTSTPLIAVGVGGGLSNLVAVRQGPAIVGGFDSNGIPFVAPSNSAKIFPSVGRIAIQNVDTTTTNTTSETAIILPNIGSTNLDAGTFEIARVIDIYDSGEIWLTSGTTKRFFVRVGGNIAASGHLTVGGAVNQARYELRSKVFVVTKGSSGQIRGEGSVVAFSANGVNFSCNLTNTTVNMNLTTNIDLSVAFTAGATTDSVISKGAIVSEIP